MLIGLPLLLFAIRIKESFKYAGKMLLAFSLCCLAGLLCTGLVGWWLSDTMADSWKITGMLTGLYTGGTPNVQAIGIALDAPPSYLVLIQAADVLLGGAYLLGLISFLPTIYARIYPAWTPSENVDEATTGAVPKDELPYSPWVRNGLFFLLGLLVTGLSLLVCKLLTGDISNGTLIILSLTSIGLLVGNLKWPQQLGDSYPLGEYFILIFCVALGLLADFRQLADEGMDLLYFSAIALGATTLLHLLFCYLLKIDRDTVILSSVAGLYGPVFVVQVATAIKNKPLMAAGLAVSLIGFGIGNYLGLGIAYLVHWLT